jgi:hypothetical protein
LLESLNKSLLKSAFFDLWLSAKADLAGFFGFKQKPTLCVTARRFLGSRA